MLALTPTTVTMLRSVQEKSDEKLRRLQAEVAAKKANPPQRIGQQRFARLIDRTASILRTGEPTQFAYEGACRYGIRSSLCLEGWRWSDADAVAAEAIKAAFRRLGVARPTFYEGQPAWTQPAHAPIERVLCMRCGRRIPEGRGAGTGTQVLYCSDVCRGAASADNWRRTRKLIGEAEHRAALAALQANRKAAAADARVRICEGCGEAYINANGRSVYCSRTCANAAAHVYEERKCEVCRKRFRPKKPGGHYCSSACRNRAYKDRKAVELTPKACEGCGQTFQPNRSSTRFCNMVCATASRNAGLLDLSCQTCRGIFRPRGPFDKRRYCSPNCRPSGKAPTIVNVPPLAPDELEPLSSAFRCDEV